MKKGFCASLKLGEGGCRKKDPYFHPGLTLLDSGMNQLRTRWEFVRTFFAANDGTALAGPLLTRVLTSGSASAKRFLPFLIFGDWGRRRQRD